MPNVFKVKYLCRFALLKSWIRVYSAEIIEKNVYLMIILD